MINAIKSRSIIFLFLVSFFIYLASSPGNTPYNYFTRLAMAFLEGRLYLTDNPSWLSELITITDGKYTFVNPPLPAAILTPFVAIFGGGLPQQFAAHATGAGAVVLSYILAMNITRHKIKSLWVALALGIGSIVWFLSSVGSVWYLGQITAVFFILASLVVTTRLKPSTFHASIYYALACFSRTQFFVIAPLMLALMAKTSKQKLSLKKTIIYFSPVATAVLLFAIYNYARFGSAVETGYRFIPGIMDEPWFASGIFHPSYIPNHLKIILTNLPAITNKFPYIVPTWWGLAIWVTSPAFVYALFAPFREKIVKIAWACILAIALVNFSFGSTGFTQFGYRYAVDFYPFIILLLCFHLGSRPLTKLHWILLALSTLVNLWGVVWINKFGWVV